VADGSRPLFRSGGLGGEAALAEATGVGTNAEEPALLLPRWLGRSHVGCADYRARRTGFSPGPLAATNACADLNERVASLHAVRTRAVVRAPRGQEPQRGGRLTPTLQKWGSGGL